MPAERRHTGHRHLPPLIYSLVDYMGLLKRLLGDEPEPSSPDVQSATDTRWVEDVERFGDIRVDVVGESHYQPAIRAACDWRAVIAGRASSDTDNLGVFLHLDAEIG